MSSDWPPGRDSAGYQPLAAYGPVAGGYCRERRLSAEVAIADVIASAGLALSLVRRARGFRWIAMVHDGDRPRALTLWSSLDALEHFDTEHSPRVTDTVESRLPHDPWSRRLHDMRVGRVLLEVASPTLPQPGQEIAVWDPPGAFLIDDVVGGSDGEALAGIVRTRAIAALDRLAGLPGFQLLLLVGYEHGACSLYLGFGRPHTAAELAATPELLELRAQVERAAWAFGGRAERYDGRLAAWYMRDLSG